MHTIEIDFEVFKDLTMRRATEQVSYNDVLRSLLKLPAKPKSAAYDEPEGNSVIADKQAWVTKGVAFPSGTAFKATYKGGLYTAKVESGKFIMSGKEYESLSAAGIAVTKGNVNGWRFWQCKRPADGAWMLAEALRG